MTNSSPFIPPAEDIPCATALNNPGVAVCCAAAHRAFCSAIDNGKPDYVAESEGIAAYRRSLPPLDTLESIRNFISCIAHGIAIRAIDAKESSRLLYAAQCAVGALRKPKAGASLA